MYRTFRSVKCCQTLLKLFQNIFFRPARVPAVYFIITTCVSVPKSHTIPVTLLPLQTQDKTPAHPKDRLPITTVLPE